MATIPTTQKFHTVDTSIDTHDFGSAQLAAGRSIFTMQDILDTVPAGGISLTTSGVSGVATLTGTVLNIPNYGVSTGGTVTSINASIAGSAIAVTGGPVTLSGSLDFTYTGAATDYINGVGDAVVFPDIDFTSLTTTGTSGAATLTSGVLNIPNYTASLTGTGVVGTLALWNTANEIRDSIVSATASLVTIGGIMDIVGPTLQMPDLSHIVNAGDPTTKFGFANAAFYEVRINGALAMAADPTSAALYAGGVPIIATNSTGVQVNGNVNTADVIATGDVGGNTVSCTLNSDAATFSVTAMNTPPASATATGTEGDIRWTAGHVYLCTATNTWVRAALATF